MGLRLGERGRAEWIVVYKDGQKTETMPKRSALDYCSIFDGKYIMNIKTKEKIFPKKKA
jgi:hypothetical protein